MNLLPLKNPAAETSVQMDGSFPAEEEKPAAQVDITCLPSCSESFCRGGVRATSQAPVEKPATCSREWGWSWQLSPGCWHAVLKLRGGCNLPMSWCSSHPGVQLLQLPEGLLAPYSKTGIEMRFQVQNGSL
ncbi:uncharacterized protein LOC119167752 isoform X4 [Rhipicephalus microplus]|uniref:uncharacterized protein LOC119167752 isoform X4 n=1 Tax=Rhipicephalus microplus TaxID=6941 RepID=UPI003F6D9159